MRAILIDLEDLDVEIIKEWERLQTGLHAVRLEFNEYRVVFADKAFKCLMI